MQNCIFCQIANNEIPAEHIINTEHLFVIKDRVPKAPKHYLIIPKQHIQDIQNMTEADFQIGLHIFAAAKELSKRFDGIDFKLLMNNGYNAGQRVMHAHVHFLAGKQFGEV